MDEKLNGDIASALSALEDVAEVWGFGSYFRGESYADIDLAIVIRSVPSASIHDDLLRTLHPIAQSADVEFDIVVLTRAEFEQRLFNDPLQRLM